MSIAQQLPEDAKKAFVIIIKTKNDTARYLSDIGKNQIINAWSLAGAKIFSSNNPELEVIENFLANKGYTFQRQEIGLIQN